MERNLKKKKLLMKLNKIYDVKEIIPTIYLVTELK